MRTLLTCSLGLFIFLGACIGPKSDSKDHKNEQQPNFAIYDTLAKAKTDSLLTLIHETINSAGPASKIPYTLHDPTDTIYFWTLDNQIARISLELNIPNGISWPVFYLYRGDLIYIRYRYYLDSPEGSVARESMIYFEQNRIAYCEERILEMEPGGVPAGLRAQTFSTSTRSVEEIEADYKDLWQIVLNEMEKYKDLPDYMKKFMED